MVEKTHPSHPYPLFQPVSAIHPSDPPEAHEADFSAVHMIASGCVVIRERGIQVRALMLVSCCLKSTVWGFSVMPRRPRSGAEFRNRFLKTRQGPFIKLAVVEMDRRLDGFETR